MEFPSLSSHCARDARDVQRAVASSAKFSARVRAARDAFFTNSVTELAQSD
jgi:hypothetical protein